MAALEQLLLFALGIPLGIATGMGLARLMGYTASFLTFTPRPPLPVSLQGLDWGLVGAALLLALFARLLPLWQMTTTSVVQQERARSRSSGRPFWQRAYLDLLLLLPTLYVYQQLRQRGSFAQANADSPFQDPLLVLAPALTLITAAFLLMRLFPLMMTVLDWLAERMPWITPHLMLRQLGRNSAAYTTPLLLVIVLLGMGIYTVSMAASLDQWLVDRVYYAVGSDARFLPVRPNDAGGEAVILPPELVNALPGVAASTRVGDYPVEINSAGERLRGRFLGVDRLTLPQVLWFRPDFAADSVGALMNQLALNPDNILVSQHFLAANTLAIGDTVSLSVGLERGIKINGLFTIAGSYTYFPTAYDDEIVMIGNLERLFLASGAEFPAQIWLRLQPGSDASATFAALRERGLEAASARDVPALLAEAQAQFERVGIFGTLSVGFVAAALMAALSLLVHGSASLNERVYQFGVLRALGLHQRQVLLQVGMEYTILTLYGAGAGTLTGAFTATLFAPFFRITGEAQIVLPPLIPLIAWDQIFSLAAGFTLILVMLEIVVITRGLRQRLFTTLRLGNSG